NSISWPAHLAIAARKSTAEIDGLPFKVFEKLRCFLSILQVHWPILLTFFLLPLMATVVPIHPFVFIALILLSFSMTFMGFIHTNNLLRRYLLVVEGAQSEMTKTRKVLGEIVISYRPIASWEKWLQQRLEQKSWKKLVYVLA